MQNNMSRNKDHAVEIALYFDDLDIGSSPEKATANAKSCNTDSGMPKLTNKFDKLALPLTEALKFEEHDKQDLTGYQSGGHQQQPGVCFRCDQPGQASSECPKPRRASPPAANHYAQAGSYGQQCHAEPAKY